MRIVMVALALATALGCGGKARHVVIDPDEVPGRRSDGWRVTSEPSGAPRHEPVAPAE